VRYGLQLTLLGYSRASWLAEADDMELADGNVIARQATRRLVALRVKWLCYERSDGEESVLSALSCIYLQVEKHKSKYQAPGTVTWDEH
jgi:hypothetical protein